jgi:hypothetical protein
LSAIRRVRPVLPSVARMARSTLRRTPSPSELISPRARSRTLLSRRLGSSSSTELSRSCIRKLTSAAGRAQFSEEKA